MSAPIDGGPIAIAVCRKCSDQFPPKPWQVLKYDYECPRCKRARQNAFNAEDPLFKEKRRKRNSLPHVASYQKRYLAERVDPIKRKARRKVATEIEAGRLLRMPCEVCGELKSEAHHENYRMPLQIKWLCRRHHGLADAALATRDRKEEA